MAIEEFSHRPHCKSNFYWNHLYWPIRNHPARNWKFLVLIFGGVPIILSFNYQQKKSFENYDRSKKRPSNSPTDGHEEAIYINIYTLIKGWYTYVMVPRDRRGVWISVRTNIWTYRKKLNIFIEPIAMQNSKFQQKRNMFMIYRNNRVCL